MIAGAQELTLDTGGLRFSAAAMGEGPLVLLWHGFPDTPSTWSHQLPALAAAGYRAVAVTARGYEPSSQPADGSYYIVDLAGDMLRCVDALGAERAHLIGHDWGATIAFAAVALAPARFSSLSALAVPTPRRFGELIAGDAAQLERSAYVMFFQQVGEAEAAIAAADWRYVEQLWLRWSPGWSTNHTSLSAAKAALARPGALAAALAYYRQAMDVVSERALAGQALLQAPTSVPTLGLYGADDGCIGADIFERAMRKEDFSAGLRLQRIGGAGHFLHQEQPQAVNAALLAHLRATG
jgi:pimeloyl-ACP methyl ester carboxylesterase